MLSNQYYIIIHLGMSGNLVCNENCINQKNHNHIIFYLSDNKLLIFNDPRRFGIVILLNYNKYTEFFKDFAIDALSDEFNNGIISQEMDVLKKIIN
ncbi:hypothetical protein EMUR_02310 [Ehrlichia muris AS145]|uniref:Formamidopyrimidine-DNA glycosylase catalytic domain-containing protein n=1 Tax=Ehrlichia muris AS145 TaxID=1423892 RepID=V9R8T7_9RICK|nr:hypothetical protein EMUR_02310 [Ehrlichia muris AS145]